MTTLARQMVWPDAAGTPTDPDTAFATVGPGPVYEVGAEREVALVCAVTGGDMRAIQVLVESRQWEITAMSAWRPFAQRTMVGCPVGLHGTLLDLPEGSQVRFSARRIGGTVNSLLTIRAQARTSVGAPNWNGQPIELVQHQVGGVECWGDGAGAAAVIPAAGHVAAPAAPADAMQWIPTGEADTLVVDFTASVAAPTSIEFEVRETTDDAVTTGEYPAVNSVVAGVVQQQIAQEQLLFGANVTRRSREISVRPNTGILILAQRTGGGAGTEAFGVARLYRLGR